MAKVIDVMKEAYPGKLVVKDYKNGIGIFLWCEDGNTHDPVFVMDKICCNFWRHPELSKPIEAEINNVIRFYFKRNHLFRGCKEYDDLNTLTGDVVTVDTENKEKTMDMNNLPEGLAVNDETNKVEYAVGDCIFESTIAVPSPEPVEEKAVSSAEEQEVKVEEKAKKEPNGIYVKKYYVEEDAMATGAMDDMIEVIHSAKKPTVVIEKLNDGGTRVWGTACLTRGMIEKIAKANGFYHDEIILDPYSGGWDADWDLKKDLKESSMDDLEAHWLDWACDIVHNHYGSDKVIALCIKNKVLDIWNCPAEFFNGCYHKATSKKK